MPAQVNYPGVSVEEIPGGSQTITGTATSITAFMGRAGRGPLGRIDGPPTIFSFDDYLRNFGELSHASPMSYAVRDFFLNGGVQAVIVRLFEEVSNPTASSSANYTAQLLVGALPVSSPPFSPPHNVPASGGLLLKAANPGLWGNQLCARVDIPAPDIAAKVIEGYAQYGVQASDLFNLTVYDNAASGPVQTERYMNLAVTGAENPNRIDRVLASHSQLVRTVDDYSQGGSLDPNWFANWNAFSQWLTTQNLSQAQLLGLLPNPNSVDGALATGDSEIISSKTYAGDGIRALDQIDLFNLLCIPPDFNDDPATQDQTAISTAQQLAPYCVKRRAVLLLDSLNQWMDQVKENQWEQIQPTDYGVNGDAGRNCAVYFPRVVEADPLAKNQPLTLAPCGIIAGIIATMDATRGIWKAPAGIDAALAGILQLEYTMTDPQNGILNPLGINCLRSFPTIGPVVWGARTLRGADQFEDDYKYLNVRRLALYIEESLYRGTQWAVFEPNDQTLWTSLRQSVNTFLSGLQQQGAFYSFFVNCDSSTTTPDDIAQGIVNIIVGFAPVEPAEFVVIEIQQQAAQSS